MLRTNGKFEDKTPEAPDELVTALRELPRESLFIPPTLDEVVLRAARKHLEGPRKRASHWLRFAPWAVTVAMLALILFLAQLFIKPASKPDLPATFAREDLNHDGHVDILDAFALARQLKSGPITNPQLDMNGDGLVDDSDAATIASHAVKLEKGGRS